MSNERIRLDNAIETNANGIKTLERIRDDLMNQSTIAKDKALAMWPEINARKDMDIAMQALQNVYGDKESTYFVIPNVG